MSQIEMIARELNATVRPSSDIDVLESAAGSVTRASAMILPVSTLQQRIHPSVCADTNSLASLESASNGRCPGKRNRIEPRRRQAPRGSASPYRSVRAVAGRSVVFSRAPGSRFHPYDATVRSEQTADKSRRFVRSIGLRKRSEPDLKRGRTALYGTAESRRGAIAAQVQLSLRSADRRLLLRRAPLHPAG